MCRDAQLTSVDWPYVVDASKKRRRKNGHFNDSAFASNWSARGAAASAFDASRRLASGG